MITLYKDNRSPSLTDTITIDGAPYDLTGATVKLQMRAVDSTTLTVDTAASVVSAAAGTVRYDWASGDVDAAGEFVAWWSVTAGGKTQDTPEFLVQILEHGPASHEYVSVEEVKSTLSLSGQQFADADIRNAIAAASRAIDAACQRWFWKDTVDSTRYYTASSATLVPIDDLADVTSVATDNDGSAGYATSWTENTHYTFLPVNAEAMGFPRTALLVRAAGGQWLPTQYPNAVRVVGKFGWDEVPPAITVATSMYASRLLQRMRSAPFGVVTVGIDAGAAMRISRFDPDVEALISPYKRLTV